MSVKAQGLEFRLLAENYSVTVRQNEIHVPKPLAECLPYGRCDPQNQKALTAAKVRLAPSGSTQWAILKF